MKNNIYINLSAIVNYRKGKIPLEFSEIEKQGFAPYIDIKLFDRGILSRFAKCDTKVTLVNKNDVLVVWDGARFGLSAIGWEGVLGSTIVALNSQYVLPKFLFYFIQSNFKKIQSKPRGVGIPHVEPSLFWNLPIPVPPMAEQKRIAKKIEELFGVIDEQVKRLEATHAALVSYRQSILQQAFSGKLYKTTNWDNYFFSDLCTYIQRGKSPKYTEQSSLPVINQKCIRWNELQTQYLKFIDPIQFQSWTKERHVKPMDILWNSTGTGTIGRAYLYKGTELSDAVVDSHVTILRANPVKVLPHFLFLYIQSPFVQQKIEKMQSGSTNQVELARKEIQNISISLPSLPEQKAIVKKIENAFAFADKAQAAITGALEQAKQLKQSILKRAFEGKLVPQDPNDKPVDLTQIKKDKHK